MSAAHVSWIHVAPIKALAVQELQEVELGRLGVENDRRFCIVDPDGKMLNAKRVPGFVAIRPHFDADMCSLVLEMPDGTEVSGPVRLGGAITVSIYRRHTPAKIVEGPWSDALSAVAERPVRPGDAITVSIYRRHTPARIVEGPWSDALSAVAERPVRLVRFDDPGEGVDRTGEDAGATLLSEASLHAIGRAAGVTAAVDPRRFRMLFGVAGVDAHAEDTWIKRRVHIGAAIVVPRGNVGRCAVTTLDPLTGVSDLDTLAALATYRGASVTSEPLAFGIWGQIAQGGVVRIGDPVHVV